MINFCIITVHVLNVQDISMHNQRLTVARITKVLVQNFSHCNVQFLKSVIDQHAISEHSDKQKT